MLDLLSFPHFVVCVLTQMRIPQLAQSLEMLLLFLSISSLTIISLAVISAYFGVTLQFVDFMSLDDHDRLDWSHLKMSHGSFCF